MAHSTPTPTQPTNLAPHHEVTQIRVENLPSTQKLKGIMTKYLLKSKLHTMLPWKHTAWVAAGFPVELCYALNIFPLHPENSACISGARKVSQSLIETAESLGFSRDLCSYFKTNVGAVETGIKAGLGGIDKPTFLASTNTICDTHVKWFQTQARRFGVPYFGFDIPSAVDGVNDERIEEYVDYVVDQFHDFFGFVETHTEQTLKEHRFFEILQKSDRLAELWQEIYEYRKISPTPVAFQDTLAAIFPLVLLPGFGRRHPLL
ncbi:MAG: 2-hydroxyacyl-CoA dehydratase [Promethearchaeota archaeon]|nr:MAG: 2-hydroxyacyl-CoA dehydratase [Candidatus Lokiarchaeota archaeon]